MVMGIKKTNETTMMMMMTTGMKCDSRELPKFEICKGHFSETIADISRRIFDECWSSVLAFFKMVSSLAMPSKPSHILPLLLFSLFFSFVLQMATVNGHPVKRLPPIAVAHGEGLKFGYIGLPNKVFVDSITSSCGDITVEVSGPGTIKFETVHCNGGRCQFSYIPEKKGDHFVIIRYNNLILSGKRFIVPVKAYRSRFPKSDPKIDEMRCKTPINLEEVRKVLIDGTDGKNPPKRSYTTSITVRSLGQVNSTLAKMAAEEAAAFQNEESVFKFSISSPTVFVPVTFFVVIMLVYMIGKPEIDDCNKDNDDDDDDDDELEYDEEIMITDSSESDDYFDAAK